MLTDDEILTALDQAPMTDGPRAFALANGRAVERLVLAKLAAQPYEQLYAVGQRHGLTSSKVEAVLREFAR